MKILYLHSSTSFGGSSKSLIELYSHLKVFDVHGTILCPPGGVEQIMAENGMKTYTALGVTQFDNTLYGYYKGPRWLILGREIAFILPTLLALFRLKKSGEQFDIIHANDFTLLLVAILAKKMFKCPLVVHIRSLQRGDAKDRRTRMLFSLLQKYADSVVVIDETVKASLPDFIKTNVIYNGFKMPSGLNSSECKPSQEIPRVGIVGTLLRLKGVYEFIEAARILVNDRGVNAQFIMVGENVRATRGVKGLLLKIFGFSENVKEDILNFITKHKLEKNIELTGFVNDVRSIYPNLDILCFPSYLNACGRPVFEAAFFGIPSIVAVEDPKPDTIIDKETGLCIQKACSVSLADAIYYLVSNPDERSRLGKNAQHLAKTNFNDVKNAEKMYGIYRSLRKI